MRYSILFMAFLAGSILTAHAQQTERPEYKQIYQPVPPSVIPGKFFNGAPSDAIILFDGSDLNEWVADDGVSPAGWLVKDKVITVAKRAGSIETKRTFSNYQLHLEWCVPQDITGNGQERGNSGVFLATLGRGDNGYELQILDPYNNATYVNGMAGSVYRESIPLVNPGLKPGQWQAYDIIWTAPVFNGDGSLKSKAKVTLLFNGVLVVNDFELFGPTSGSPEYKRHGPAPIKLQAHGDKSEPISFRNIWVRNL